MCAVDNKRLLNSCNPLLLTASDTYLQAGMYVLQHPCNEPTPGCMFCLSALNSCLVAPACNRKQLHVAGLTRLTPLWASAPLHLLLCMSGLRHIYVMYASLLCRANAGKAAQSWPHTC